MRPELDAALVRDFPQLYRDRNGDPKETLMCWGFTCDDGWEPIIRALSALFEAYQPALAVRAVQVKEKFGTLRFYLEPNDDYTTGAVDMAQELSAVTCERCGTRPASLAANARGSWVKTLCPEHAAEWVKPRPPPEG